ncbi:MAG: Kelch repeat-containing protein [Chloroflexia bacterium]
MNRHSYSGTQTRGPLRLLTTLIAISLSILAATFFLGNFSKVGTLQSGEVLEISGAHVALAHSMHSITRETETQTRTTTPTRTIAAAQAFGVAPFVVRAPLPYTALGVAIASDGTYIYANGGSTSPALLRDETYRYDPAADAWTPLAPSSDRHYNSPAVYGNNGKIYVLGGVADDGQRTISNANRIYDIATNSWSAGAPMPLALGNVAAAYHSGNIYMAGGHDGSNPTQAAWAYDIAGNKWTRLANMPQPLSLPGFGVINGKLYIAGGTGSSVNLNTLYAYDITANSWTRLADLPQGVDSPGSAVVSGKLWLFGGGAPVSTNSTQIYDPATNIWTSGPSLNQARSFFYGTAAGSAVAAIGGFDGADTVNTNEVSPNTPIPAGVLVGHVTWQGRPAQPSALQQLPITLTLKSGSTEVNYPYQITDASGFFTTTVDTLPTGIYNWRVKGPTFLATSGILTLAGAVTNLEMGLQRVGDLNGDNQVNTADFTLLKVNFGQGGAPPVGP